MALFRYCREIVQTSDFICWLCYLTVQFCPFPFLFLSVLMGNTAMKQCRDRDDGAKRRIICCRENWGYESMRKCVRNSIIWEKRTGAARNTQWAILGSAFDKVEVFQLIKNWGQQMFFPSPCTLFPYHGRFRFIAAVEERKIFYPYRRGWQPRTVTTTADKENRSSFIGQAEWIPFASATFQDTFGA